MTQADAKPLPDLQRFDATALIQVSLQQIRDYLGDLGQTKTPGGTVVRFLYVKQEPKKAINVRPFLLLLNNHLVAYAAHNSPQLRTGPQFDLQAYNNAAYLARTKFRIVNEETSSGQLGEFVLFCLIEAYLNAPQAVSKMHYKGENQMEVPGVDGIHARWDAEANALTLVWGESKIEKDVMDGIRNAFDSLVNWKTQGQDSEDWDFLTGIPSQLYEGLHLHLKQYRDNPTSVPFKVEDEYAIFVGYEEAQYSKIIQQNPADIAADFLAYYETTRAKYAEQSEKHHTKVPKPWRAITVFLLPFPDINDLREKFERVIHGQSV